MGVYKTLEDFNYFKVYVRWKVNDECLIHTAHILEKTLAFYPLPLPYRNSA